jgi:hypothetical protein
MSLPLAARKDIRDHEEKIVDVMKQMSAAFGFEVTHDISWEGIAANVPNIQEKQPGRTVYVNLASLLKAIQSQCKDDALVKQEFARVISKKKVSVVAEETDGDKRYVLGGLAPAGVRFVDGMMQVVINAKTFGGTLNALERLNVAEVMSKTCVPPGGMPLLVRHALHETEPARAASLKKISAALGHPIELEFDPNEFYQQLGAFKCHAGDREDMALFIKNVLDGLANLVEKSCKDSMVKEAIQDAMRNKKIKFLLLAEIPFDDRKKYAGGPQCGMKLSGGDMIIVLSANQFSQRSVGSNVADIKIQTLL